MAAQPPSFAIALIQPNVERGPSGSPADPANNDWRLLAMSRDTYQRRPSLSNDELDPALSEVSRRVIGCAIEIHKSLGPGFEARRG
jgi:hypothetical protein